MSDIHSLERTSPKGPGQEFVGYCTKCGKTGLRFSDLDEECANPGGISQEDALIAAIEGPEPQ